MGKGKVQQAFRQTFTVPVTAGFYAPERLAFGEVPSGLAPMSFEGTTASVLTSVATAVIELWVGSVGITSGAHLDTDYTYSGQALDAATGAETFVLAGYPCFQFRVKSGGTAGNLVLSGTAY